MTAPDGPGMSDRWRAWRERVDLDEYETRWARLEAEGGDIHGEADFIEPLVHGTVVDAGCGTGRIGVELARRGHRVIGVDNDADLLRLARAKAPDCSWLLADLAEVDFGAPVDTIALAGNVMIFCEPGTEGDIITNLARRLQPGGTLIAGHSLADGPRSVADYDGWATEAGLSPVRRCADWQANPYAGGDYCVFVDTRPAQPGDPKTRSR